MKGIKEETAVLKMIRRLSIFFVFVMVIGLLHSEPVFAERSGYTVITTFNNGYSLVIRGKKYGITDSENNIVLPIEYDRIDDEADGFLEVKKGEKYGFIDKEGNITIPVEYDMAYDFSEGLAPVKKAGKWGFIDKENEEA